MKKTRSAIFIPGENKIPANEYLTLLIAALDAVNEERTDNN